MSCMVLWLNCGPLLKPEPTLVLDHLAWEFKNLLKLLSASNTERHLQYCFGRSRMCVTSSMLTWTHVLNRAAEQFEQRCSLVLSIWFPFCLHIIQYLFICNFAIFCMDRRLSSYPYNSSKNRLSGPCKDLGRDNMFSSRSFSITNDAARSLIFPNVKDHIFKHLVKCSSGEKHENRYWLCILVIDSVMRSATPWCGLFKIPDKRGSVSHGSTHIVGCTVQFWRGYDIIDQLYSSCFFSMCLDCPLEMVEF